MQPIRPRAWLALLLALLGGTFAMNASAALDTTARTTDHSVNVPTGWWIYTGQSAAQVSSLISANSARLTQIEVDGLVSGAPRFTVRMVRNSGSYAVPGWWWYYGLTFSQVGSLLSSNNARLIDLEPYDAGGGAIRYAAVMVSNTGVTARAWSYLSGVNSTQISSHLSSSGHRLVDIDNYYVGTTKFYSVVAVANTGADAKSWQWWVNQSTASVASRVNSFSGRIVKLDRNRDGSYNFIQVNNTGTNGSAWWYQYGFTSGTALLNYANQVASRPIDVRSYTNSLGQRRYDAVFIDNANASTRRVRGVFSQTFLDANGNPTRGIFEAFLKQAAGTVRVDLNSRRRAETASSLKSLHLLHSMRRVAAGTDTLGSSFVFYNYSDGRGSNSCPNPAEESSATDDTSYNFEKGLDEMMRISDNRTTRGVVRRYGGFSPFNSTATSLGLTGTTLRHNIGCAYRNVATGKYTTALRNDTTAADLARIYEGVWNSTLLSNTNSARTEFLESAKLTDGAGGLQTIINQEATKLGKSSTIASQFGAAIRRYGKGGSYGTCLPNSSGDCGQRVTIRSGTGLIRLPVKVSGIIQYRTFAYGHLISDVPVPCWNCASETVYINGYSNAALELFRDEINSALQTW
jgi:beta-lactamase class A